MGRAALPACAASGVLVIALLVPGCLTSTVRYGNPGESPKETRERLLTPLFDTSVSGNRSTPDTSRLSKVLNSYRGTPYLFGGMSRDGVDCSGLVCLVFREIWNMELPRSTTDMVTIGTEVRLDDAKAGDLVFFRWGLCGGPDHVGIYTGSGRFVHASKKLGVIESTLADNYYGSHLFAMRRVVR
jgi:probable lipoprotein NlpC